MIMSLTLYAQDTKAKINSIDSPHSSKSRKKKVRILYFTSKYCGPCKIFEKSRNSDSMKKVLADTRITKISAENDKRDLIAWYKVRSFPTFLKLDKKNRVVAKLTGVPLEGNPEYPKMSKLFEDFIHTDMYNIQK